MPPLLLRCSRCGMIFNSGFNFGPNVAVTLKGNQSQCPRCGSMQSLPEGTFQSTVEGIMRVVSDAPDRRKMATELLAIAQEAQKTGDLTPVRNTELNRWLPSDPANAIGYLQILIGVLQVLLQLLLNNPQAKIEYNQTFINNYNTVAQAAPSAPARPAAAKQPTIRRSHPKELKVGRNDKCACGSGKKFKRCHGRPGP